jgi:cytochrome c-type biogenesis protein CcmE
VAQGKIGSDGVFQAEQVLAKHDENYMPPEAGAAIDAAKHEREAAKSVVPN